MDVRSLTAVIVVGLAISLSACTRKAPDAGNADDTQRQALTQRVQAFQRDAAATPQLTPARKAELEQLATEVRAWQARTGRGDVRVTKDSIKARRNDNPGGGSGCEDCPGYRVDGDRICFLESEGECPVDDGDGLGFGRVCVYTCIWIGAEAEPAGKGGAVVARVSGATPGLSVRGPHRQGSPGALRLPGLQELQELQKLQMQKARNHPSLFMAQTPLESHRREALVRLLVALLGLLFLHRFRRLLLLFFLLVHALHEALLDTVVVDGGGGQRAEYAPDAFTARVHGARHGAVA